MKDTSKDKANPITDFVSIFTSDSKFNESSGDDVDYDEIHLAPISDLFNNDDESKSEK
ncbi:hypothetical protein [Clostridium sp. DJ247]|uniref:hypothetical protein n=1 Tax=Clostridium sp. DJ247 TaxID=2726188 RepID=UPI001624927F|nr:hypothetical protein [Clostridium sp. DJ247]MBC2581873.1 hypothetical protein [Clostridium sp. DJ247]